MTTITNKQTGETIPITRDVATEHPAWVHEQCGTNSESELQQFLDGYSVADYYAPDGSHKGIDECGIAMFRD